MLIIAMDDILDMQHLTHIYPLQYLLNIELGLLCSSLYLYHLHVELPMTHHSILSGKHQCIVDFCEKKNSKRMHN